MPVDPQPLDNQRVELPGQEVGQVERAGLGIGQGVEHALAGIERIAVRPGDPLDAFLGQHGIEPAAGTAVAVENQDASIVRAMLLDLGPHGLGDPLRPVVQQGPRCR